MICKCAFLDNFDFRSLIEECKLCLLSFQISPCMCCIQIKHLAHIVGLTKCIQIFLSNLDQNYVSFSSNVLVLETLYII